MPVGIRVKLESSGTDQTAWSTKALGNQLMATIHWNDGPAWPRRGDYPYMVELERPIRHSPGVPVQFTIYVDGTICEVYVDDQVAMSARMYDHPEGNWGLFVSEGSASFSHVGLAIP